MPGFTGTSKFYRFADLRWAGFSAQLLMRRTENSVIRKLSAENETPPVANGLLMAGKLLQSSFVKSYNVCVLLFCFDIKKIRSTEYNCNVLKMSL